MLSQTFLSPVKTNKLRVIKTQSFKKVASNIQLNKRGKYIDDAQAEIWQFFLNLAKSTAPEIVLTEFENLFIIHSFSSNSELEKALKVIVSSHNEQEFRNTLKRCIYILLNTWIYSRKYQYAQTLIEKLSITHFSYGEPSKFMRNLKIWMMNFIKSPDYQEVKLFASRYVHQDTENWKFRYTSYLLTPQYLNSENSLEQRQAARRLSQQLQDKYKFDLAMYTVHSDRTLSRNSTVKNPTALGDEALRLIKTVLAKNGPFNHVNLAAIFLDQTQRLSYSQFKQSLLKYLIFSLENSGLVESIKMHLTEKLNTLYQHEDQQVLQQVLILRTANRMIEYLTIGNNNKPSDLFVLIASQGNALTLGMLILKVLLISPHSRTYLELCMSKLIDYYGNLPEQDCQWVINFLEVSKIILTMYTGDIKYNLVNIDQEKLPDRTMIDENGYRIFCQVMDNVI